MLLCSFTDVRGYAVAQLIEALSYTPVGRVFDSRWGLCVFHWSVFYGHTMALWSCYPLTEIRTRDLLGVKAAVAWSWQPCHLHVPIVYISWKPQPLGYLRACLGLYRGSFTLLSQHPRSFWENILYLHIAIWTLIILMHLRCLFFSFGTRSSVKPVHSKLCQNLYQ